MIPLVWTPSIVGAITLVSRAVDDSANLETPQNGVTVNVVLETCPCSIWNSSSIPGTVDAVIPPAVELGVKFRPDVDGSVIGIRYYKATKTTGTHVRHNKRIWRSWSSAEPKWHRDGYCNADGAGNYVFNGVVNGTHINAGTDR
jgi:hypothetical protein